MREAILLANRHNVQVVILGDLFDRARETDMGLLSSLVGAFKEARFTPMVLVGNHDKTGKQLTDDTTLAMLGKTGVVRVFDEPEKKEIGRFTAHFVPYGFEIPKEVMGEGFNVVFTHHDLAIAPNLNPKAVPPYEIKGAHLVVNGHDHTFKKPVQVGATTYFNPGNIARVSIAQFHHEPAVFILGEIEEDGLFAPERLFSVGDIPVYKHRLQFSDPNHVFDMTGYNAKPQSTDEALAKLLADFTRKKEEEFIEALAATSELQSAGGGNAVAEIVRAVMNDMNIEEENRSLIEQYILSNP